MKIYNNLKIIKRIPVIQQYRLFKDRLDSPKILGIIFSFTLLSLLSITFLFSVVNAIEVKGDFNGDGNDDLAIGVPGEDLGSIFKADAGVVEVIYGSSNGLSATSPHADQFWTQDSANIDDQAETGDQFGRSLAIGDFNGDGFDDLAVGVLEDFGTLGQTGFVAQTGAVEVIYGSSNGLSATSPHADQFWTPNSADIEDNAKAGDQFGFSLAAADFNGDGKDDLAIGVPFKSINSINYAGAVQVIYGSSSGLSATSANKDQFWSQQKADVDSFPESGDQFGYSLAAADFNGDGKDDLAIGVPDEDIGYPLSISDAGAVQVLYGSPVGLSATFQIDDQFWTQNSANIDDQAEYIDRFGYSLAAADFNGDGKDDLAIDVPFEGFGSVKDAGAVQVIYGSSSGLSPTSPHADQFWTQDSTNIDDQAEDLDEIGFSLAAADFNGDGKDDLAIGIPHESGSGAVEVIYGSSSGLSATSPHADQFWTQDSTDIENQVESGDVFGQALAIGDFNADGKDDLSVGVPYEDLGSTGNTGAVEVIYGSSNGLSATLVHADQFWTQDSTDIDDSAEAEDHFALSLR